MKDGSEVCPKYKNGICEVLGRKPDVKLLCGEVYSWTLLMKSYRDCKFYRNQSNSKDSYNPNVKSEELEAYTIGLTNWLANISEEELKIMINRLKGK